MALQPFTKEQLNYFKFASIVLDEFPRALRQTFVQMWDNTCGHLPGHQVWDDSPVVRNLLLLAEGGATKIPTNTSINDWNCSALFQATIFARSFALPDSAGHRRSLSDLYVKPRRLPPGTFHPSVISPGGNMAETFALAIDQLRLLRNKLCHSARSKIDTATFHQYVQQAKEAFTALGVNTAFIDAIGSLTESDFPTPRVQQLEENVKSEGQALIKFLEEVKKHIGELRQEMRPNVGDLLASQTKEEKDDSTKKTKRSPVKELAGKVKRYFRGKMRRKEAARTYTYTDEDGDDEEQTETAERTEDQREIASSDEDGDDEKQNETDDRTEYEWEILSSDEDGDEIPQQEFIEDITPTRRALDVEQDTLTADIYYNLGNKHQELGDYSSAVKSKQRALDIRRKLLGEQHTTTADTYYSLGGTQHALGDYTLAVESFKRALDIRRKLLGEEHTKTADSYYGLGITQNHLEDFTSAVESHKRALDIRRKLLNEEHTKTADSYYSLGIAQNHLGDYTSAVESNKRAVMIRSKLLGEEHTKTADSYEGLGGTQHELGDYSSAVESKKRAVMIRRKLLGEKHTKAADSYESLGGTQHALGDYTAAVESFKRALEINRKLLGEEHTKTADSYENLGVTQHELGDYTAAIESKKRASDIRMKLLASDPLSKPKALLSEKSLLKRDRKTNILRGKVKEEGDFWELTEAAAFISFPPKAVIEPMDITCSLWSHRTCSPPLGENEALVSNVIELSCDGLSGLKLSRDFNEGVTLALSHSATDLKGYEVVIQQLINPKGNEWKDLETKNTWKASDIQGDPFVRTGVSGLIFPLAEAKVTQCSSFAVIWRLKSFTFSSNTTSVTDPVFTCMVPEYPDVSVSIPRSDLPESGDFSLTIKVQEIPCDVGKDDGVLVGPILHISSSPDVQFFKEPVIVKIPFSLREAKKEFLDLSSGQLRIIFFNCGAKYPEWTEITGELETPADVKDGVVTFQVKHFSKFVSLFSKRKRKPSSSELQHLVEKPKMPQEAGFLACLRETSPSGTLMLTLCCYPRQMGDRVNRTVSLTPKVLGQVQKNGFEEMCKGDKAFVSAMKLIKPLEDIDLENFSLRFLGDATSERDMLVSVEGEGEGVPKVELMIRREDQQEEKLMCELFFSELQTFASTSGAEGCSITTSTSQTNLGPTSASLEVLEQGNPSSPSDKKLKVTLLADEWGSCKGGLSTINRELAMHLAKHPRVEVTCLLPHCSDRDKEKARQHDISIVKAEEKAGFEPQVCLSFPPADLTIDIVIGHGVKLGRQAPIIRDSHECKWIQVVHTAPEELGMYKSYSGAISKAEGKHEIEVELCKRADLVVAIGPKLTEVVSCSLRSCGKDQDVFNLIPGTFIEFFDVKQASQDRQKFRVLIFGRGDPEDFSLKGFDIAAQAVAELKDKTYQLVFVGAPGGKQEELANKLIQFIPKNQLTVKGDVQSRQKLKELFCEMDLAVMPSRTEGFGLTALEALSAGLPVLVSGNSGFGEALQKVQSGSSCVVESEDASDWAKAIKSVRNKTRELRLKEVTTLREYYAKEYSWEKMCNLLVEKMWNLVDGSS